MKQAGENSNSLKMVFRNRPENEKIVRTTAAVFASVLDPTLEEISDFKTAVSEAVTNAIIHAYPKTGGDIEAYFKREDKKITVLITDYGIGIKDVGKSESTGTGETAAGRVRSYHREYAGRVDRD